jgi:hypothetical protein
MKKVLFILALALPMVFVGCSKEEQDLIWLNSSQKTLYHEDEFQIEATSNSKITYSSENEYHAKVSETGLVTAQFVGETNILLSNSEDSRTFKVTVQPKINLYPEPDVKLGDTKSSIIAKFGSPDSETENVIAYTDYSSAAPILMFSFDASNKMTGYSIMVNSLYSSVMSDFFLERYLIVTERDGTFLFINGISLNTATMAISLSLYNTSYWQVIYMPNTEKTSSASLNSSKSSVNTDEFDEILKQLQ